MFQRPNTYDLTDPEISAQFFHDEYDPKEDPLVKAALKKVDFSVKGPYCHNKGFASSQEAFKALEENKTRIFDILNTAKQ